MIWSTVVSCEHASHAIPPEFQTLFATEQAVLESHRGWDIGALPVFEKLYKELACPHFNGSWSRLLCDLNRSARHQHCFSQWTAGLNEVTRQDIIAHYHQPYRKLLEACIDKMLEAHLNILHISVHSFTPILNGVKRNADIGLLYDPKRQTEFDFARHWQFALKNVDPTLRVRLNYPYQGKSDGICTYFRKKIDSTRYIGIELEMNQALTGDVMENQRLQHGLVQTVKQALQALSSIN